MTDVMKNITKHYQHLVSQDLNKMHVPEWDMDIYYRTTSSFADEKKMIAHQTKGEIVEALISSIIAKTFSGSNTIIDPSGPPSVVMRHKP